MTLVAGEALDPKKFFKSGNPVVQGSSFDLTIGSIFDHDGKKVEGLFTIKPGQMVQVVSSEVFSLSRSVTGHVTYKTTMTRKGIWALTVGIVDPGWDGPIATTLLNFSRTDHAIAEGDPFLRVSFFEHDPVPDSKIRKAPPLEVYLKDIQKIAATMFASTFLNTTEISEDAGRNVLDRLRKEALVWVAAIALLFTIIQGVAYKFTQPPTNEVTKKDLESLRGDMNDLQKRLQKSDQPTSPGAPSRPKNK